MSKTDWSSEANRIIDRLAAVDHARPAVDRPRVEEALGEHFRRLGLDPVCLKARKLLRDANCAIVPEDADESEEG